MNQRLYADLTQLSQRNRDYLFDIFMFEFGPDSISIKISAALVVNGCSTHTALQFPATTPIPIDSVLNADVLIHCVPTLPKARTISGETGVLGDFST